MNELLWGIATIGMTVTIGLTIRAHHAIRKMTLQSAWWWSLVAETAWLVAIIASSPQLSPNPFFVDVAWYLACVLTLCPLVSVLGARKPVAEVWSLFIVAPLIFVLCLPVFTSWGQDRLYLENHVLIGFCLVALMGGGNYLGTRHTFPVLLIAASLFLVMSLLLNPVAHDLNSPGVDQRKLWGGICLTIAVFSASVLSWSRRQAEKPLTEMKPQDRLWSEFFHLYGILWAKRILERVNRTAEEEKWPGRLDFWGLTWSEENVGDEQKQQAYQRFEHTLRWLFKRFVTADWIDEQLQQNSAQQPMSEKSS